VKNALRRDAVRRLRAIPPEVRAGASAAIATRVWMLPEVAGAQTLLLFASTVEEPDTDAVAAEAVRRGIRVAYPRSLAERRLSLHAVPSPDALRPGRYGIREPDESVCEVIEVDEVDVALIPGLAWDRDGRRLGRGAGYYDRLLGTPGWRGYRCGIFFASQEVPVVPAEGWDVPLDAVVTEREVVRTHPHPPASPPR
jgi:5-formyltetrahydrofolate cyclo-ligase